MAKLSLSIGGLMFGVGIALVGTCGFGKLGTWRSRRPARHCLILGLAALATTRGVTAMLRAPLIEPFAPERAVHRERGAHDGLY